MSYHYIRQKNNYSCGPVAIYNLLTWSQNHELISYRDIFGLTKCNPTNGTSTNAFGKCLKTIETLSKQNLSVVKIFQRPNIQMIVDELLANPNRAAIVEYFKEDQYLHFVFVYVTTDEKRLITVNQHAERRDFAIQQTFQKKYFQKIARKNSFHYPIVWILENAK